MNRPISVINNRRIIFSVDGVIKALVECKEETIWLCIGKNLKWR